MDEWLLIAFVIPSPYHKWDKQCLSCRRITTVFVLCLIPKQTCLSSVSPLYLPSPSITSSPNGYPRSDSTVPRHPSFSSVRLILFPRILFIWLSTSMKDKLIHLRFPDSNLESKCKSLIVISGTKLDLRDDSTTIAALANEGRGPVTK